MTSSQEHLNIVGVKPVSYTHLGFLVKTGKYREGDENKINPPPFKTVPNFAAAVEEILKEINSQKS